MMMVVMMMVMMMVMMIAMIMVMIMVMLGIPQYRSYYTLGRGACWLRPAVPKV